MTFNEICVVGDGRVGRAVSARLRERGLAVRVTTREPDWDGADLVLLCVPDRAIGDVAAQIPAGPWIAHTSGATTLTALAPHTRRFSVHPLQTFVLERGPEQLDGVWSAVSGESPEALEAGTALAELLGLRAFELADADRPLYHAGAAFAAAYLVTLHQAASDIFRTVGAPPEALEPLMRRTMDNGFEPTGPHRRGDWATVDKHLAAIHERRPELEPLYRALSDATAARPT
jgi:predicted short-subunit dehydrogenase-like oxidoreductase (DUF2520 family)